MPENDLVDIELFEEGNEYAERKNFNLLKLPKEVELEQDIKYTLNLICFYLKFINLILLIELLLIQQV